MKGRNTHASQTAVRGHARRLVGSRQCGGKCADHQRSGRTRRVNDKWDVKEPEKGHKLVDYAGRCVSVPDDPGEPKYTMECVGKYEYMPDGSWKGAGTCTVSDKGGGKINESWEEGSHLKEYPYKYTGGTGKYEGATGGGTYTMEELTDTLLGGRYKGELILR